MQKYKIGDRVKIVDLNVCVFGISPQMKRYIGMEVQIIGANYDKCYHAWCYTIGEDGGEWWWDDNRFEPVAVIDLPEFSANESDALFSLLS